MAERRMFARSVIFSDDFQELPSDAQRLYFCLGLSADDDGFINQPRGVIRQCGCSREDLKALEEGKFVIVFESGVIVVRHWQIHNYIQKDRYHPTLCVKERNSLEMDEQKCYCRKAPGRAFRVPTLAEIRRYCEGRKNTVDPEEFFQHYQSLGWCVEGKPMRSWKAAIVGWEKRTNTAKKEDDPFRDWLGE